MEALGFDLFLLGCHSDIPIFVFEKTNENIRIQYKTIQYEIIYWFL